MLASPQLPEFTVEQMAGVAMADAVVVLAQALVEKIDTGHLVENRKRGGDAIAALFAIQRRINGSLDFPAVVRKMGKVTLRQRLAGTPFVPTEADLDAWISLVLEILG